MLFLQVIYVETRKLLNKLYDPEGCWHEARKLVGSISTKGRHHQHQTTKCRPLPGGKDTALFLFLSLLFPSIYVTLLKVAKGIYFLSCIINTYSIQGIR